ncbi:hypothetical protein E2320_019703 [Naja naja]|nr:hypothetical protein E2320_019703 [Naja naja]
MEGEGSGKGGRGANSRRRCRSRHLPPPSGAVPQPGQRASLSPVSLGNLQLKAAASHSTMYPGNKRKKLWREEKERLLKMTLEERRKEYLRDYVPLKDIATWKEEMKNKAQSDGKSSYLIFICTYVFKQLHPMYWLLGILDQTSHNSQLAGGRNYNPIHLEGTKVTKAVL